VASIVIKLELKVELAFGRDSVKSGERLTWWNDRHGKEVPVITPITLPNYMSDYMANWQWTCIDDSELQPVSAGGNICRLSWPVNDAANQNGLSTDLIPVPLSLVLVPLRVDPRYIPPATLSFNNQTGNHSQKR